MLAIEGDAFDLPQLGSLHGAHDVIALGLLLMALAAVEQPIGAVALCWYDQATVPAGVRQRVVASVSRWSAVPPDTLAGDVIEAARWYVTQIVTHDRAAAAVAARDRLDAAGLAYRAGDVEQADRLVQGVLEALRTDPGVPGAPWTARQGYLLAARVAWTEGDVDRVDDSLRHAIVLDPHARLSTRSVPPELAQRYEALRRGIIEARGTWRVPAIDGVRDDGVVEIDGQPGLRAIPLGMHFVQVANPGRAAVAAYVDIERPWSVPSRPIAIAADTPVEAQAFERVCEVLQLERVVLARHEGDRIGLQAFVCGRGFSQLWVGEPAAIDEGARTVVAARARPGVGDNWVADVRDWPPRAREDPGEGLPPTRAQSRDVAARSKLTWLWVTLGVLVASGIVTGAVLGARAAERGILVDGDRFTQP